MREYERNDTTVGDSPVIIDNAGGDCDFIFVGEDVIDANANSDSLRQTAAGVAGGHVVFVGTVRGGEVLAMTVEHYQGMTENALSVIAKTAKQRWRLSAVTIVHRIGRLLPGEIIVFVGCCAPHRKDAFIACEYMVDRLKTDAPFWKKEEVAGAHRWVVAKAADSKATRFWEAGK